VLYARAWDEAEELPRSLVGTLAEAGFLAAALPEELGGGGLDSVSVLPALRGARPGRLVGARDRLRLERPFRQDGREVGDG
jgi:alkylation response protein AidB-like acyl-CoA dehydrogenase